MSPSQCSHDTVTSPQSFTTAAHEHLPRRRVWSSDAQAQFFLQNPVPKLFRDSRYRPTTVAGKEVIWGLRLWQNTICFILRSFNISECHTFRGSFMHIGFKYNRFNIRNVTNERTVKVLLLLMTNISVTKIICLFMYIYRQLYLLSPPHRVQIFLGGMSNKVLKRSELKSNLD